MVDFRKSFLMSVLFLSFILCAFMIPVSAEGGPGFEEVVGHMDLTKKTSLHTETYWNNNLGSTVTWSGSVYDVKGGRGKAVVYVANKAKPLYKGYNIVLTSFDMEAASNLEINQRISFSGQLQKCKNKKGRPIIIYLNNVEFQ